MSKEQACTYDSYAKQSAGANRTAGWKFTPAEDITVSAIRIKGTAAYTTKAQIWKYSDGTLVTSTDITLVDGSWVEQPITPVTLSAGTVYVVSQNVYTAYGYYGKNGVPASSFFSSKIASISDVRIDSQNVCPTGTVGWFLAIDFIIGKDDVYKTFGNAIYMIPVSGIVNGSSISWTESKPDGTSIAVSVSADGTTYNTATSGGALLAAGTAVSENIYIKVELSTTIATSTPTVSGLHFVLQTTEDKYSMILEMQPLQRILNAAGDITVAYDGGGSLVGEGGAVLAFTQNFAPTDLVPKPHQNDVEHIEVSSVAAAGTLTKINYTDTAEAEHIEITGVTAVGTLTKVSDI